MRTVKEIYRALRENTNNRAIFKVKGEYKTIKAEGLKFNKTIGYMKNECMGVYTPDCPREYVQEDWEFMEYLR